MTDDYSYIQFDDFFKDIRLPREHFLKISNISGEVWRRFPFLPYGDQPKYGRSVLNDQLSEIDNINIRDCKLPTYIFANIVKELGYDIQIFVKGEEGYHPYLAVRLKDYQDLTLLVSFNPLNYTCRWLTHGTDHSVIRWGDDLNQFYVKNGFVPLPENNSWTILDENYLKEKNKEL